MLDPESSGPVGRSWAWSGLGGTAPLTGVPTCCRKGLTFVSVHDCFWTHAADVAVMNQVPAPPSPWSSPRGTLQPLPQSACWSQRSPWGLGQGAVTLPLRPLFRLLPSQVCREQFVRLHSQPILHDLSRFLVERFCSGPR